MSNTTRKSTLIITVGTSIIANVGRLYPDLGSRLGDGESVAVAGSLAAMEPEALKAVSAELNSTISMIQSGIVDPVTMFLVASDTDEGRRSAELLKRVFTVPGRPFTFRSAKIVTVDRLNDEDFETFRRQGLGNLVTEICSIIRSFQGGVAINNTGGYKAEIAFAAIIGQAFSVPVYYQHERFGSMIELPPLPISVDISLWIDNIELFMELKEGNEIRAGEEWRGKKDTLAQLVETVDIDGEEWISLSPAGHLFMESCEYRLKRSGYWNETDLPEADIPPEKKEITLCGDHHGNDRLMGFARKICASRHITKIVHSLPFEPQARGPVRRITCVNGTWCIDFVMVETDTGYALRAGTTARSDEEARLIAARVISENLD
ncbi:MAG TPA: putative CRISPR-associated protein [Spirochaetota bacterium]|nr:putative CRISPR-associated protein [Spirochaetota bacterium]